VAARVEASVGRDESDVGGVGGTLAGNVLSPAAVRATLEYVLTDEAFDRRVLPPPFHNMAIMSPATTEDDVDLHTDVFGETASELIG
jgi:hypothetical protein